MTDLGWSVERMREAAREAKREGQLGLHGFVGGEVTGGTAVRVITRVGRTFSDSVFLEFDRPYPDFDEIHGEWVEVSRSPFAVVSDCGPVTLVDRRVVPASCGIVEWIEEMVGSLGPGFESDSGVGVPGERMVMPDDRFWGLIGVLEGDVAPGGLMRLADALAELPDEEADAFGRAFQEKCGSLAAAGNTAWWGQGDAALMSDDASLYYQCEIIARGRNEYETRLEDPRRAEGDDGATGELLLEVIADVVVDGAPDPAPRREHAITFSGDTDAACVPGPFSFETQLYRLRLIERPPLWYGFFAGYAVGQGYAREMIGCTMCESLDQFRPQVTAYLQRQLVDGESLWPDMFVDRTGIDGVTAYVFPALRLERKLRLDMEQYLDRFYYAGTPPVG